MSAARFLAVAGGLLLLAACAEGGGPGGETHAAAVARGEALAGRACGSCHGMGREGASHFAGAQPFRDMKLDLNAISYERRMAQMHQGRVSMPPADISLDDVRDIDAYVRSLKRGR